MDDPTQQPTTDTDTPVTPLTDTPTDTTPTDTPATDTPTPDPAATDLDDIKMPGEVPPETTPVAPEEPQV